MKKISTGIKKLDEILGGGLLPSSNVIIIGATGAGKTVLSTAIAAKSGNTIKHQGIIFDYENPRIIMEYARKMYNWPIRMLRKINEGYYENKDNPSGKEIINGNHSPYYNFHNKVVTTREDGFISSNKNGKNCIIFDGLEIDFSLEDMLYLENHVRKNEGLKEICLVFSKTSYYRNIFEIVNASVSKGGLDSKADTILALGYLPINHSNPMQKKALAVIKHRRSKYDGNLYVYNIGKTGLEVGERV